MTNGTTTWSYEYNADGLRTSRSNGTTTYEYIYNGSSLVQMTVGNDTLYFGPGTVTYDGVVYYYVTNLQGDVIAILDSLGANVVEYSYDAWGNILSTTGSMANTLGAVNPLRYRGYVFDQETSLYYLQSRYYNSEIGRFINADSLVSTGQGFLGCNMFAYCNNNPIMFIDPYGDEAIAITLSVSFSVVQFVQTVVIVVVIVATVCVLIASVCKLVDVLADAVDDLQANVAYNRGSGQSKRPSRAQTTSRAAAQSPFDDDDDDDDDDYYDNEDNFGGKQKMGKCKGKTPRNNQVQNKQFKDATKGVLTKDQQGRLHAEITGEGLGYHDLKEAAKTFILFFFALFEYDD